MACLDASEIWKPIVGFEELYEVSSLGRVRALPRTVFRPSGKVQKAARLLTISPHIKTKYNLVRLTKSKGDSPLCRVCVLVCEAFHGARPHGMFASHRNGNRQDDRADNLRWLTRKQNESEKVDHGTLLFGENSPVSKYTLKDAVAISEMRKTGLTYSEISDRLGFSIYFIASVCGGYSWKRALENYYGH